MMYADRTNRLVIGLVGLIAVAVGVGGLLAAGGVFGHTFQHRRLIDNGFSRYVGDHGVWLWPVIAAVALVLVLLSIVWLFRLLFSTDRARSITIDAPSRDQQDEATPAGRTTMTATAVPQAVTAEIDTYHGVTNTKARMLGEPSDPTLAIEVTAGRRTDLAALIERVEREAIAHVRTALEKPELPVRLDISISQRSTPRTH